MIGQSGMVIRREVGKEAQFGNRRKAPLFKIPNWYMDQRAVNSNNEFCWKQLRPSEFKRMGRKGRTYDFRINLMQVQPGEEETCLLKNHLHLYMQKSYCGDRAASVTNVKVATVEKSSVGARNVFARSILANFAHRKRREQQRM